MGVWRAWRFWRLTTTMTIMTDGGLMAIAPPALYGFALACARARNDGEAAVPRVVCGRWGHRHVHRHCEAAKRPKQSRWAGPRVVGGRRTVLPRPIPDCLAPALLGCAVTGRSHGNPP